MHNKPYLNYKAFLLVFLSFFTAMLIAILAYHLHFDIEGVGIVAKILFFDKFFIEYILLSLIVLILINKNMISSLIAFIIFIFYLAIATIQVITFLISKEFLSKLAISNVEFIGFLITFENIIIIVISTIALLVIPFFASQYVCKKINIDRIITKKSFTVFLLLLMAFFYYNHIFFKEDFKKKQDVLLTKNYLKHTGAIESFIKLFEEENNIKLSFSKDEVIQLHDLGYTLNIFEDYPLMKDKIFNKSLKSGHTLEKPNVIIIFTEGLSARTTSVYSDKYKNLTPNLKKFSENNHTMRVKNFYNHTAATYRGLHGQLCSLYPIYGKGDVWFENDFLNLSTIDYKCLPHILKNNGYETAYLNMHYIDESANDEMVSHFGFDTILSGESLSIKYLSGIDKIKNSYLSDHQSYKVLVEYLKEKENNLNKPFLLTTYTIETHAYVDIGNDGIVYNDGKNNVLNTIHNLDNAFGKFWEYFKNSKYSKNTIILFTSDHAHYYGKEYINLMEEYGEEEYYRLFIDKVPLLIYSPTLKLAKDFDANQATSIDIAPTILHLINAKNEKNAFIGHSLFEKDNNIGIASYGKNFYMIKDNKHIYVDDNVAEEDKEKFKLIHKYIEYTHQLEKKNKIYEDK